MKPGSTPNSSHPRVHCRGGDEPPEGRTSRRDSASLACAGQEGPGRVSWALPRPAPEDGRTAQVAAGPSLQHSTSGLETRHFQRFRGETGTDQCLRIGGNFRNLPRHPQAGAAQPGLPLRHWETQVVTAPGRLRSLQLQPRGHP